MISAAGLWVFAAASISSLIWGDPPPPPAERKVHAVTPIMAAVRRLQTVTDDVVLGVEGSYERRLGLSASTAEVIRTAPGETWSRPSDVNALLSYVLMGGDPEALRDVLRRGVIDGAQRTLALGVLAFAERRPQQATAYLDEVDTAALPLDLAMSVRLVQAGLLATEKADSALDLLREVQIGSRGTQLESSARRQMVSLLIGRARIDEALEALVAYYRRFPRSLFNDQYSQQLAAELAAASTDRLPAKTPRLAEDLARIDPGIAVSFLTQLASHALFMGRVELAVAAGNALSASAADKPEIALRGRLYARAAEAATGSAANALAELRKLPREALSPAEAALLDASIAVASEVLSPRALARQRKAASEAAAPTTVKAAARPQSPPAAPAAQSTRPAASSDARPAAAPGGPAAPAAPPSRAEAAAPPLPVDVMTRVRSALEAADRSLGSRRKQ